MKISVVVITFNEEDRLKAALESCLKIADEIVVCDSFSTDRTVDIAHEAGAVVFQNRFEDYAGQKNLALSRATREWVLNLDADERVSEELGREIAELKKNPLPGISGYLIQRRTWYLGRWIRHSGWYPDRKIRLFKKEGARWTGRVHERLEVEGPSAQLSGDIEHFTYRNIADHIGRLNRYSELKAEELKNSSLLLPKMLTLPFFTFVRHYLLKLGFLDGFAGLVIAVLSAWGTALKYLKAIEIKRHGKTAHPPH